MKNLAMNLKSVQTSPSELPRRRVKALDPETAYAAEKAKLAGIIATPKL